MLPDMGRHRVHLFCDLDGTVADAGTAASEFLWHNYEIDIPPSGHNSYSFEENILRYLGRNGMTQAAAEYAAAGIATRVWEDLFSSAEAYREMQPLWPVMRIVRELCQQSLESLERARNSEPGLYDGPAFNINWFVTARPLDKVLIYPCKWSPAACERGSLRWLARWGLWPIDEAKVRGGSSLLQWHDHTPAQPPHTFFDFSLQHTKRFGESKAERLQHLLRYIGLERERRADSIHDAKDIVVILDDKPDEIYSLIAAAADGLQVNSPGGRPDVLSGIKVVVITVPQPWNRGEVAEELWEEAGRRHFPRYKGARYAALGALAPQIKSIRPHTLEDVPLAIQSVLDTERRLT